MPYPKMKNPCSDKMFVDFLVDCMKLTTEAKVLAKEIHNMTKKPCAICGNMDEVFKCDSCNKEVCQDHITRQRMGEDDGLDLCTECLEKD